MSEGLKHRTFIAVVLAIAPFLFEGSALAQTETQGVPDAVPTLTNEAPPAIVNPTPGELDRYEAFWRRERDQNRSDPSPSVVFRATWYEIPYQHQSTSVVVHRSGRVDIVAISSWRNQAWHLQLSASQRDELGALQQQFRDCVCGATDEPRIGAMYLEVGYRAEDGWIECSTNEGQRSGLDTLIELVRSARQE